MTEKHKFLKIFAFVGIIVIIISILSAVINPSNTTTGMDKSDIAMMEFFKESENTIDVVVLGDSEAYRSIVPLRMYEEYGFATFVNASSRQKSNQTYNMLEKTLTKQSPKVCILETNMLFRRFSVLADATVKVQVFFPVFKYHNIWKSGVNTQNAYNNLSERSLKGYRFTNKVSPVVDDKYIVNGDMDTHISKKNLSYLDQIIDLCKENDIELIFISSPTVVNWNISKHNALQKIADENNITYLDFNTIEEVDIDWSTDTFDEGDHVNHSGAVKVTDYLGKYLSTNFDLPDHRNDEAYASWDIAYDEYMKKVNSTVLINDK